MLDGELQQLARFLEQQVDLGMKSRKSLLLGQDGCSVGYRIDHIVTRYFINKPMSFYLVSLIWQKPKQNFVMVISVPLTLQHYTSLGRTLKYDSVDSER